MTTSPVVGARTAGWTADDSTFGARLALVRQRMQWGNVKEAAVACGLPVESWRTWERDGVAPRRVVEIAEQIATRTGCDYFWLLTGRRVGVVSSSGGAGQTTVPTVEQPKRPRLTGQMKRAVPAESTRRPARIVPGIAELMPDLLVPEVLAAAEA